MNAISRSPAVPKAIIMRVAIENVVAAWEQMEPLAKAAMRGIKTHTTEDVRHRILSNQATAWVQWSDHVEAFAVTEFVSYPQGLCLRIWLGGATREDRLDIKTLYAELKNWARANKCRWIESVGRIGWTRIATDATIEGIVVRHELEDAP